MIVDCVTGLELRSIVLVPETVPAVAADRRQRSMSWMKSDVVDSEDVLGVRRRLRRRTMTFEREIISTGIGRFHVHNRHATFDGAHGETVGIARFIRENGHATMLVLEQRFDLFVLRWTLIE